MSVNDAAAVQVLKALGHRIHLGNRKSTREYVQVKLIAHQRLAVDFDVFPGLLAQHLAVFAVSSNNSKSTIDNCPSKIGDHPGMRNISPNGEVMLQPLGGRNMPFTFEPVTEGLDSHRYL